MFRKIVPLLLLSLACGALPAPAEPTATLAPDPTDTPVVPTLTPTPTLTDDEGCPLSRDKLVAVKYPQHGYCMLLPPGYVAYFGEEPFPNVASYTAGSTFGNRGNGDPSVSIYLENINGRSPEEISSKHRYVTPSASDRFIETTVTMSGEQAVLFTMDAESPGQRLAILPVNDLAYVMSVSPYKEAWQEPGNIYEFGVQLWETIHASFTLIEARDDEEPSTDITGCTLAGSIRYQDSDPGLVEVFPWEVGWIGLNITNESTCAWGPGFNVAHFWLIGNDVLPVDFEFYPPLPLFAPGDEYPYDLKIGIPYETPPGTYTVQFQLQAPDGSLFGEVYTIDVTVLETD